MSNLRHADREVCSPTDIKSAAQRHVTLMLVSLCRVQPPLIAVAAGFWADDKASAVQGDQLLETRSQSMAGLGRSRADICVSHAKHVILHISTSCCAADLLDIQEASKLEQLQYHTMIMVVRLADAMQGCDLRLWWC